MGTPSIWLKNSEFSNLEVKVELIKVMHSFVPSQSLSLFSKIIFPLLTFSSIKTCTAVLITHSHVRNVMPLTVGIRYVTTDTNCRA